MLIAAATPRSAQFFTAEGFPRVDAGAQFSPGTVALGVHKATETSHGGNVILLGTTLLLGEAHLKAAISDMAAIAARGERPLVVVLSERTGNEVSVVVSVVPMERRVLH
jgi:hypothetical protein